MDEKQITIRLKEFTITHFFYLILKCWKKNETNKKLTTKIFLLKN